MFASASPRQATPTLALGRGSATDCQISSRVKGDRVCPTRTLRRLNQLAFLMSPHIQGQAQQPQVCLLLTLLCPEGGKPLSRRAVIFSTQETQPRAHQPVFLLSRRSLGTILFCQSCGLVDYNSLQLLGKIAQKPN